MDERGYGTVNLLIIGLLLAGMWLGGGFLWNALTPPSAEAGLPSAEAGDAVAEVVARAAQTTPGLAGLRVALVESSASREMAGAEVYDAEVEAWRGWMEEAGAVEAELGSAAVAVLPNLQCLGAEEITALERHLAAGGGVVTTGLLGARDSGCVERADTVLAGLVGGRGMAPTPRVEDGVPHLVVLGETVLGANLPAGARPELRPGNQITFRGTDRELFYGDYERKPLRAGGEPYFDGAAVRARVGAGRVVALGFGPGDGADEWSAGILRGIAGNAALWAAGRPVVRLASWPEGREAAAVFAQDVEHEYDNALNAVRVLEAHGIPGTYFLVGDLAARSRSTTRQLAEAGEIGSHTRDHAPVGGRGYEAQLEALESAQAQLERMTGSRAAGLRPPEERFDGETFRAWLQTGGSYLFGKRDSRTAAPELFGVGERDLVLLARASADDFQLFHTEGLRDRQAMAARMVGELDDVVGLRGLYMLSYHSQIFGRAEMIPVLEAVARRAAGDPRIWTATAGDVAEWWRARASLEVDMSPDGRWVEIVNRGRAPVTPPPLLVTTGGEHRFTVPALEPGQRHRIELHRTAAD